jgi:hypothetical protein
MAFKDIAGNDRVKHVLRMALRRRRLPNSLLFSGPAGVGKNATAMTVAKALNCVTHEDDACDACPSCRAIQEAFLDPEKQGLAPDVMFIEIAENKKKIAIEQIRLLKQTAYLRPMASRTRVFIVRSGRREATTPPFHPEGPRRAPASTLILVTERPHLILPTIRSVPDLASPRRPGAIALALVSAGQPADRAEPSRLPGQRKHGRGPDRDWDEVLEGRRGAWELFRALLAGRGFRFSERFRFRHAGHGGRAQGGPGAVRVSPGTPSWSGGQESRFLLNPDLEEGLWAAARPRLRRLQSCLASIDAAIAGGKNEPQPPGGYVLFEFRGNVTCLISSVCCPNRRGGSSAPGRARSP